MGNSTRYFMTPKERFERRVQLACIGLTESVITDPKNRVRGETIVGIIEKVAYALNNDMAMILDRPKNSSFVGKFAKGDYDRALAFLKSSFNRKDVIVHCMVDDENNGVYITPNGAERKFDFVDNTLYVAYIPYGKSVSPNGEYVKFGLDSDDFVYFISYHASQSKGVFVDWRAAKSDEGDADVNDLAIKMAVGWNRSIKKKYGSYGEAIRIEVVDDSKLRFIEPKGEFHNFWEPFESTFPGTMFFPYFFDKLIFPKPVKGGYVYAKAPPVGDTQCISLTARIPILTKNPEND